MPEAAGISHGLPKDVQKGFVGRQDHELYDVASKAEPQRIRRGAFFFGS
jgi:hypothetical protein